MEMQKNSIVEPDLGKESDKNENNGNQLKGETTVFLSDSMLKNMHAWRLRRRYRQHDKVYGKAFNGAISDDMKQYCKPTLQIMPTKMLLHIGTNDLKDESKADTEIFNSIVVLAHLINDHRLKPIISGLIQRADNDKFENKIKRLISMIQELCKTKGINYNVCQKSWNTCYDLCYRRATKSPHP